MELVYQGPVTLPAKYNLSETVLLDAGDNVKLELGSDNEIKEVVPTGKTWKVNITITITET